MNPPPASANSLLTGERVALRLITPADVSADYCRWLNDPQINRFLEARFSGKQTMQSLQKYVERQRADQSVFLAIVRKEDRAHIGNIKLGPINTRHGFANVGVLIGDKRHWGQGYACEAIKLCMGYAFKELKLRKLIACHYAPNENAVRAFLKAGFAHEARLSRQLLLEGKYVDQVWLAAFGPGFEPPPLPPLQEWIDAKMGSRPRSKTAPETDVEPIYLRKLLVSDVDDRYFSWFKDPLVLKYLEVRVQSADELRDYIASAEKSDESKLYAICLKKNGLHIGNQKVGEIDWNHKTGHFATLIGDQAYWGRGVATQCMQLGLKIAFEELGLHKMWDGPHSENIGSIKLCLRGGCSPEGVLRSHRLIEGRPVEEILVSCFNPKGEMK